MTSPSCPNCNNKKNAQILWGFFEIDTALEEEIKSGKYTLGGCLVTNNDPKWKCNKCYHRWGERDD